MDKEKVLEKIHLMGNVVPMTALQYRKRICNNKSIPSTTKMKTCLLQF